MGRLAYSAVIGGVMSKRLFTLDEGEMIGLKLALQYVQLAKALHEDPEKYLLELIVSKA